MSHRSRVVSVLQKSVRLTLSCNGRSQLIPMKISFIMNCIGMTRTQMKHITSKFSNSFDLFLALMTSFNLFKYISNVESLNWCAYESDRILIAFVFVFRFLHFNWMLLHQTYRQHRDIQVERLVSGYIVLYLVGGTFATWWRCHHTANSSAYQAIR